MRFRSLDVSRKGDRQRLLTEFWRKQDHVSKRIPQEKGGRQRTKFGSGQNPLVEENNAGAEGDPQGNVEGRMKAAAGGRSGLGRLGSAGLKLPVGLGGGAFA